MRVLLIHDSLPQTSIDVYVQNLCRSIQREVGMELYNVSRNLSEHDFYKPLRLAKIFNLSKTVVLNNYDLIHVAQLSSSIAYGTLKPTILTIHDLLGFLISRSKFAKLLYAIDVSMTRLAQRIICPSEFVRREIVSQFRLRSQDIRVVPLGVRHDVFKQRDKESCRRALGLPDCKKIILSVSSSGIHKNLPTLLTAFQMIMKKEPSSILVRIGASRQSTPDLEAMAEKLGISSSITYMRPNDSEMPLVYSASDVFLHTSTYEGFGLPVLEAMASGTPVIASNVTSIPEVAGNAARLLNPFDAKGFAEEAIGILSSDDLAAELSVKGRIRSRAFSWAACGEKTLGVYEEIYKTGIEVNSVPLT